ncbi:hypothetical protein F5X99DRAFT_411020 [Biscogniauxia marginata]|nr:hypothetical protein F5X99DRAFT_411020 [Biscogniauxia marginata]
MTSSTAKAKAAGPVFHAEAVIWFILLVKARLAALFWPSIESRDAAPAVKPIQAVLNSSPTRNSTRPQLLIHALSGGGSCSLYNHFSREETSRNTDDKNLGLPMHVAVFDSTPGVWSYQFNIDVLTASIKPGWRRLLALPVAHLVAVTC